MSQAPAMPVFVDAMLGDTLHCDSELFGAYHFILYATWRANGAPLADDDAILARICRMPLARWRKVRPILEKFFDISDGFWRQKRLQKEWLYVQARAERARQNGQSGGRPAKPTDNPAGSSRGAQTESTHTHTHTQKKDKEESPIGLSEKDLLAEDFEEWWGHVPRKVGKDHAKRAYRSARKRVDAITLLAGIDRYTAAMLGKDPQYVKHPATWLNGACWLDEPEEVVNGRGPGAVPETLDETKRRYRAGIFDALAGELDAGRAGAAGAEPEDDSGGDRAPPPRLAAV